jgi:hypothetical protein
MDFLSMGWRQQGICRACNDWCIQCDIPRSDSITVPLSKMAWSPPPVHAPFLTEVVQRHRQWP